MRRASPRRQVAAELFGRQIVITVDTLRVSGLRMAFEVQRNLRRDPNTAALTVYNLSAESRSKLQQRLVRVTIEAGYPDNIAQVFRGTMRNVMSTREGVDWITKMEAGDGDLATARVNRSFRTATYKQAVLAVADVFTSSLGLGLGNLVEEIDRSTLASSWAARPVVLRGPAAEVFDRFMGAAGLEWSVQDGQLQVVALGQAFGTTAVLLTPSTGLIGAPEIGEASTGRKKKSGGTQKHPVVKARSLMQPDIVPGRRVDLRSEHVTGLFRCELARISGDNWGQDWYVDMELKPL